jgi:hypothetical protein
MSLCSTSKVSRGARHAATVALAAATIATTSVIGETALAASTEGLRPAQAADPCPAAFPVEDLTAGQVLEGLTVDSGKTPEPFTATVIGVVHDLVAPDFDTIVVEADSNAIDAAGGIWAGMSGSPVYAADGRLVGAVALTLTGSTPIAGITPATEMQKLLTGGAATAATPHLDLPAVIEKKIVASGAATAQEVAAGMRRLPLPVTVSGTDPARLRRVSRILNRHLDGARVYSAGRASARAAALELVPGGNVAAAVSYGNTTLAAVGTVTAVCDDEALLFGHPLLFNGATTLSAHQATAVFVQPDPIFGPFKVANVGGISGTVDQDRRAGLHVDLSNVTPPTTRLHSALTSTETGDSRTATTRLVLPDFIWDVTFLHTLNNLDRVNDQFGPGVVTLTWGASGKRSDGSTWSFRRHEKLADNFDVTFVPAFKLADDLYTLLNNPFEDVTIDDVTMTGTISPTYAAARLVGVERLGANGQWQAVSRRTPLRLVAGSEVFLRGVFQPFRSTRLMRVQLSLVVPRVAGSTGSLALRAGASFGFFEGPGSDASLSFDDLVADIDQAPTGDTLRAELSLSRESPAGPEQSISREVRATAPTAIFGGLNLDVRVVAAAGVRR